jgi:thiamine-monophosphate kinase
VIYEDKLPIDKQTYETAAEFSMDPNTCALNGGEDYELLFTIPPGDFERSRIMRISIPLGICRRKKTGRHL